MRRLALLCFASLLGSGLALTAPPRLQPIPKVQPGNPAAVRPGALQPTAPGTLAIAALPELVLTPPVPGLAHLQYRGNGFIEVAAGTLLLSPADQTLARARALALQTVEGALKARPGLSEVDVSAYRVGSYAGFGGPPPIFTASVPRARLNDFRAYVRTGAPYDRVYEGVGKSPSLPPAPPLRGRERQPTFYGSTSDLLKQQVDQAVSQFRGGVRGGLLFKGTPRERFAALSFDDAPHPLYEPLLLDLLRRAGVHATFFVIGRNAEVYPYFVRDMVQQGHEVGNHTYHHVRLPGLPEASVRDELARASAAITAITGQPVRYFRPPGGDYSPLTLRVAESLGLTTTFWTDDPGDFANPGDRVIESRLVGRLRPGGIVLLHDNAPEAIDVLQAFLHVARTRQTGLGTVGELARVAAREK